MLNDIHEIASFTPMPDDTFMLDTNVLIKIFYPTLGTRNSAAYINLYQKIRNVNAKLLISSIQLSEFVNRCIRFQFDLYRELHPEITNFKEHYRNTNDYQNSMNAIIEIIANDMFPFFTKINDNFASLNEDNLLMRCFSYDFNDAVIAEICRFQNAFLITDDRDYANYLNKLKIITNNPALLMFKSQR